MRCVRKEIEITYIPIKHAVVSLMLDLSLIS